MKKLLLILPLFFALASCGSGGSSSEPSNATSVVSAKNAVRVSTYTHISEPQSQSINITVSNAPEDLYYRPTMEEESTSISDVNFSQSNKSEGILGIQFASGTSVSEGTHLNKVSLTICHDVQCERPVAGSPIIINTTLEVTARTGSVSVSNNLILVEGNSAEKITPEQSIVPVTISGANPSDLHIEISENSNGIDGSSRVDYQVQNGKLDLLINFSDAQYLSHGSHDSSYQVNVCHDYNCNYPLVGSPLTLSVSYEVSKLPEGVDIAAPDIRAELNHDVIDAEYSAELNAVVIASSTPNNAVYLYYLDDVTTAHEIPLDSVPTAISVADAGDSNKIAVGHDAKITFISIDESNPNSSAKTILDIPIDVYDLAATQDAVYAVPRVDQWENLHRVNVSDNSITNSSVWSISGVSKIKVHPNLQSVYLVEGNPWSNSVEKVNIQTIPPANINNSADHNIDYDICGNLWISNSGNRIYTACGNTFRSSDVDSQEMTYTGKLPLLSVDDNQNYSLTSVAESRSKNEIVAIEKENEYSCSDDAEACLHTLSFFTKDFLNRVSASAFNSITVAGNAYTEEPGFVFYNNEGTSVFVISQLVGIPTQKSYILEFNR